MNFNDKGLRHGKNRFFYHDGKLKVVAYFNNGKREGESCLYDSITGALKEMKVYKEGVVLSLRKCK